MKRLAMLAATVAVTGFAAPSPDYATRDIFSDGEFFGASCDGVPD